MLNIFLDRQVKLGNTLITTPQAKAPRSRITFDNAEGVGAATWGGNATTPASASHRSPLKKELSKIQSELRVEVILLV